MKLLKTSYRMFILLGFLMVTLVMLGRSPVAAQQVWNCYPNPYACNYPPGYPPPNGYDPCQPIGDSNTVQCPGYLYQDSSGCVELVVTVTSTYGLVSTQYYTLHNLPSSYTIGAWVTVTGTLYQGYNYAPNGAACPGNYINVTTLS